VAARGRHGARRLLVQALYQFQISGHSDDELIEQFSSREEFAWIDGDYFLSLLREIIEGADALDGLIAESADRPVAQLDPIERAVLWVGLAELESHPDVPLKVVLNEAVKLSKQFGAEDGHRFVNAVLDKAAKSSRG
jgi:N utilization substance protein B